MHRPRRVEVNRPSRKRLRPDTGQTEEVMEMSELEIKIKTLLVKVGDRRSDAAQNAEDLAAELARDVDGNSVFIRESILDCAAHIGHKAQVYAAVAALLAAQNAPFGEAFVRDLGAELTRYAAHTLTTRNLLRVTASAVNAGLVQGSGLVAALDRMLISAKGSNQFSRDQTVMSVLEALLWLDARTAAATSADLDRIVSTCGEWLSSRTPLCILRVFDGKDNSDDLEQLWSDVQARQETKWNSPPPAPAAPIHTAIPTLVKSPPKPQPLLVENAAIGGATTTTGPPNALQADARQIDALPVGYAPRLFSRKYDGDGSTSADRRMARGLVAEALVVFSGSHTSCARHVAGMDLAMPHRHLIVEAAATAVLAPKDPSSGWLFPATVVMQLFKDDAKTFAPLFAVCIKGMYAKIDMVDSGSVARLAQWFAYHLSNFGFQWPWQRWSGAASKPVDDCARLFVTEALGQCYRLSRTSLEIPEALQPLAPPDPKCVLSLPSDDGNAQSKGAQDGDGKDAGDEQGDGAATAEETIAEETNGQLNTDSTINELSRDLCAMFERRQPSSAVSEFLDERLKDRAGDAVVRSRLVTSCIVYAGRHSLSHLLALLARYASEVRPLVRTKAARAAAVEAVGLCWANSQSNLVWVLDKLLVRSVVQPSEVIDWVFQSCRRSPFSFFRYQVLHLAVRRALQKRDIAAAREQSVDDMGRRVVGVKELAERQARGAVVKAFRRFAERLGAIAEEAQGTDAGKYRIVLGCMRDFGRAFANDLSPYLDVLNDVFGAQGIGTALGADFEQLVALVRGREAAQVGGSA